MVARDGIEPPTPAFSGLCPAFTILLKTEPLVSVSIDKSGAQVQPNATIGSFGFAQWIFKVIQMPSSLCVAAAVSTIALRKRRTLLRSTRASMKRTGKTTFNAEYQVPGRIWQ